MTGKTSEPKGEQKNEFSLENATPDDIGKRIEAIFQELVELNSKANKETRSGKRSVNPHLVAKADKLVEEQNMCLAKYKELTGNNYFKDE